jgi:glucose/arabinose dehydrogenase
MRLRLLRTVVIGVVLAALLAACHGGPHVKPVAGELEYPAAFTLGETGDIIWYAERHTGEIHRRNIVNGNDRVVWTVPNIASAGEQGLLGIALHPNYPSQPYVYAFATRTVQGTPRNQILRITIANGVGVAPTAILNDTGIAAFHNGGRILFGPDGNLFAVIGEHGNPQSAQSVYGNVNVAGKVLRIAPDGSVPAGNPYPVSWVWATGIRNSFGFTFDPDTNALWLSDNGPACNDEINRIVKRGNYAWGPEQTCQTPPAPPVNTNRSGAERRLPERFWPGAVGITGVAFCSRCELGPAHDGKLLVGFVDGTIRELTLDGTRTSVVGEAVLLRHSRAVLSLETRPGEPVYFSDSQGIYRLTLVGPAGAVSSI